jgi:hypothetical protein
MTPERTENLVGLIIAVLLNLVVWFGPWVFHVRVFK